MIKYIFLFLIISIFLFFLFLILFILIAYLFIYYLLQINSNFLDYDKKTKSIIDKYKDYKIIKMYYYKQNLLDIFIFPINILTGYKYYSYLNKFKPYHMGCILLLKNSDNKKKFLKLHKQHKIYILENFKINSCKKIKSVSIHKNKYSLKELLDKTKKNMGEKSFFNWEIKNNNCQHFVKNLIQIIQKKTKKIHIQKIIYNKTDVYLLNILFIFFNYFHFIINWILV